MQTKNLLVSNLSITEDEYDHKGQFTLSLNGKNMVVDLFDLDSQAKLEEIKAFFSLEDDIDILRKDLFSMVIEKSGISSRFKDGKDYPGNHQDKTSGSLDIA